MSISLILSHCGYKPYLATLLLGCHFAPILVERPLFAPNSGGTKISSMAYDRARECVVLHDVDTSAVWEWYGSGWQRHTSSATATPQAMAFAADTPRCLAMGWRATWSWDGDAWTPVGPSVGKGFHFGSGSNETWRWDGIDWTLVPTAAWLPVAYWTPTAAIDPATGAVLVPTTGSTSSYGYSTVMIGDLAVADTLVTGSGCAASSTIPRLLSSTPLLGGSSFRYELAGAPPSSPAVLACSFSAGSQQLGGCTVWLGPLLTTVAIQTSDWGVGLYPLSIPWHPALRGLLLHAQGATLDPTSTTGLALSNALRIRIGDGE